MANNERISVLMDGEAAESSWLPSVAQDQEQQQTWARYHLVGDAMRDELPAILDFDLADRVALALQDEPTVLAPRPSLWRDRVQPAAVTLLRYGGQFAIAASVAAVSILGVQQYQLANNPELTPTPVLNTIPIGGVAAPVSVNFQTNHQPLEHMQQPAMTQSQRQVERERIAAFLRDHQLQQRLHQANE
jgi:sigma-E factor negative regulatory protein RseA